MKRLPNTRQDWSALLQTLEHTGWVMAIAFSKNGKTLASALDDSTVRLWDPTTGRRLQTLESHTGGVNTIAFSKDGKTLASATIGTVRLWGLTTRQRLQTLEGYTGWVIAIAFSKMGRHWRQRRIMVQCGSGTRPPDSACTSSRGFLQ